MPLDVSHIRRPQFAYRCESRADELDEIAACTEAHGFSIVKGLLPDRVVEILQAEVRRVVDPDGAFPNQEDHQRLSCAVGFRPKSPAIDAPWDLPASARRFIDALPARFQRYTEGYTGIDPTCKGVAA